VVDSNSGGPVQVFQTESQALVISAVARAKTIVVGPLANFPQEPHDNLVLVIQMRSAVDATPDTYAGRWELARVAAQSPFDGLVSLNLERPLVHSYAAKSTQIVRVPAFRNVRIASGITLKPPLWNGSTGGVLALVALEDLEVQSGARLSASGTGFRGGVAVNRNIRYPCTDAGMGVFDSAQRGEGIAGVFGESGTDAVTNGGGGGRCHNAGGGGGGHASAGFKGGFPYGALWAPESYVPNYDVGGRGGEAAFLSAASTRIFLGGGGGAGQMDDTFGTSGGRGGGVIFLQAHGLTGAGFIEADGESVRLTTGSLDVDDAAGGGGAGGTVFAQFVSSALCEVITVNGGNGGSTQREGTFWSEHVGPGGGGGAGNLLLRGGSLAGCATKAVTGRAGTAGPPGSDAGTYGAEPTEKQSSGRIERSSDLPLSAAEFGTGASD
jgi:hypothetical protein